METLTSNPFLITNVTPDNRASFIRKTYLHLAGAVLAFIGLEMILFPLPITQEFVTFALESQWHGLSILGVFIVAGWLAKKGAARSRFRSLQYVGLLLFVALEAVVFAPLLVYSQSIAGEELMLTAALMVLTLFGGLTATVIVTKADFSVLKGTLTVVVWIALGLLACGALFGYTLETWFAVGMIGFASVTILYSTGKIMRELTEEHYVGASLELFAAMALLFWYVLRVAATFWSRD